MLDNFFNNFLLILYVIGMISINDCCICIPARYNSSRVPGKLLLKINDKTCSELSKFFSNIFFINSSLSTI